MQNWYIGKCKLMFIFNCFFCVGGVVILFLNKCKDKGRFKYKFNYVVRIYKGVDDKCYRCVYQEQDEEVRMGVMFFKDFMVIVGDVLKINIIILGFFVFFLLEQFFFFGFFVVCKVLNFKVMFYIFDFKLVFNYFCIYVGG